MERENNDEIEIDLLEVAGELWRSFFLCEFFDHTAISF